MVLFCKLAGTILVMGSAGYLAVNINQMMEQRNVELRRLYSILLQLKSEIQYMCNPLPECFKKLAQYEKEPFKDWLFNLAHRMEGKEKNSFADIWQEELGHLQKKSALNTEDIEPLAELKDKLGSMDITAQMKAIDYALLHMERNRKLLEEEMRQKKKVVVTLSLFFGFMTLILLL
ncbi:MAG: stage III sporulation protein AB [Lachnospiraceae bacterium]